MPFTANPTWDTNGGNSWDSDPLKTWDDYYTDSINSQIQPNIEIEIWSGFSNENILIGKFNVDTIALNTVDRTVKLAGRDDAKALISNQVSTNLLKNIKNELAIEYMANLQNISSSKMDLNETAGLINYFFPQDQQGWEVVQKIGEGVGLSSLFFDAKNIMKMRTVTESEGMLNFIDNSSGNYDIVGGAWANGFLWLCYRWNTQPNNHNLFIVKYDFYTQTQTVIDPVAGQAGTGQDIIYVAGYYYFYANAILWKWDGVGAAVNQSSDWQLTFDNGIYIYGLKSNGHLLQYNTTTAAIVDLGIPTSGGNNYSVQDIYFDNGVINVTAYYSAGTDLKIFTYSGGVFTAIATFPVVVKTPKASDSGTGIYFICYAAGYSMVYKLYNGTFTQMLSINSEIANNQYDLNSDKRPYFQGKVYYTHGELYVGSKYMYAYDIAANTLSLVGNIYADLISQCFVYQDILVTTLWHSGKVYLYKPAPVVSTSPVFSFSYDGTLISLQSMLTDQNGGDNSILNDIEVKSDAQSLAASATVYTHSGVPLYIPAGTTVIIYPELNVVCDTTLVLHVTWSATGNGETSSIVQHPFKPTIILTAGSVAVYVTILTITGTEIVSIGTLRAVAVDTAAKLFQYGRRRFSLQNDYITGPNMPGIIANGLLLKYKDPTSLIESLEVSYCPNIEIEDVVLVSETNSNISRNYIVVGITHTVTSASATTKLKLIKQ